MALVMRERIANNLDLKPPKNRERLKPSYDLDNIESNSVITITVIQCPPLNWITDNRISRLL